MEVHPPDHPIMTWKQFLIHMSTICLGLLIALGLEQFAEYIHHRHELHVLHEALERELETNKSNDADSLHAETLILSRVNARIDQVKLALATHKPLASEPTSAKLYMLTPTTPVWNAARASNLVDIMPQADIVAFSQLAAQVERANTAIADARTARQRRTEFEERIRASSASQSLDFADPSARPDLVQYLEFLQEESTGTSNAVTRLLYIQGALSAVAAGERDLDRIGQAELHASEAFHSGA